ncbi:MAG: riboflavin synthase [Proteobacteria bacterium]|nr:riboflavin synthase [Pseudomonadota bacterium]
MFTGLIEQVGEIVSNKPMKSGNRLIVRASITDLQEGESIAINGTCLTWLPESRDNLCFDVSPETLDITTLGELKEGSSVNIERAMLASVRLGGHYVCGHVNTVAYIKERREIDNYNELIVAGFTEEQRKFLVPKGSITIDGISLTINEVNGREISLMIVPHTLENTTIQFFKKGRKVNVEFDYIAQIVAHNLSILN